MKTKGLKHNFFMYFIRAFSNLGFVIVIFPMVSRKLGAENLGKIQYVESIIAYFLMFINLGIETYGKREVALCRDNKEKIENLISELLYILMINTVICLIVYLLFIKIFIIDITLKKIFLFFTLNLACNFFSMEWFYVGMENQTYITKRNLFFKVFSGILIFFLVKDEKSIYKYTFILIFSLIGTNFLNFYNLKKYINLRKVNLNNLKKHLKPLCILFLSIIALSFSYNLDSIMIKNIVGDMELGYYSFAMKIGKIPLIFATSVVAIFYPRLCNFLGKGEKKEYYRWTNIGIELILLFSFPVSIMMFLFSKSIVLILVGENFFKSIPLLQIFSIYVVIIGVAYCTGSLTLIANKRDRVYSISIILGSVLNFLFNLIFIPKIGAMGAAIATLITEVVAIVVRITCSRDIFKELDIINKNLFKIILSTFIMGIILYMLGDIANNKILDMFLRGSLGCFLYVTVLIIFKEKNISQVLEKLLKYI